MSLNGPLTEIYEQLYQSNYIINAKTKEIYLIFLKPLIEKYLNNNFDLYICTDDQNISLYLTYWSSNPKIHFINDHLVPSSVPNNNVVYFYHKKTIPDKNEQLALINFCETLNPLSNFHYIYVGNRDKLLLSLIIKCFKYSLHFEKKISKWGWIHPGFRTCLHSSINKKYWSQSQKKKTAKKSFYIYDYGLFHDHLSEETKLLTFNQKLHVIKKKKNIIKTVQPNSNNLPNTNETLNNQIKTKYIFFNAYSNPNYLVLPDGTKENYHQTVEKYLDVIDI